jgi:hypothetical protein
MSKKRSVNTAFWSDPFIEDIAPEYKLLFLYLITNEKTNMLGIYEASKRKMSFETGLSIECIKDALDVFQRLGKVKYVDNYIILVNYMKHQKYNTNMKKSAIETFNELPSSVRDNIDVLDKTDVDKSFNFLIDNYSSVKGIATITTEVEDPSNYYENGHLILSMKDYDKLLKHYDSATIDHYIAKIEGWKKNKQVKSVYLTILNWLKRDQEVKKNDVKIIKNESYSTGFNEHF